MASINQVSLEFSTKGERQAIQALKNLNLSTEKLKTTQVSASQAAARLDAQRKKETRELERLRGKYIQGHAAMEMYSREMNDLARARRANIISAEQQAAEVARLNQVYRQGSTATGGFADANHIASRKTNGAGMAMQQAGYQVGDFVVQIQGGTNAFVAFGQQATQLVGVLPMLASQMGMNVNTLIKWSAGLGVAIPITTALAAAFMRTRQEAKEASESVDKFSDTLDSAKESIGSMRFELDALNAGFEDTEEFALARAVRETEAEVESLQNKISRLNDSNISDSSAAGPGAEQALKMLEETLSVETKSLEEARKRLEEYRSMTRELELQNQRQVTHQMQIATMQKEVNAGVEQIRNSRDAELRNLEQQTQINNLILKHGEDSKEVAEARLELERQVYKAKQVENGILGNNLKLIMEAYDAYVESKSAVEGIAVASGNIDFSGATASAKKLAETLGIAVTAAFSLQSLRSGKVYSGRGGDPRKVGDDDYTNEFGYTNVDELIKQLTPSSSGGGGGGSAQSTVDETEKLRESVDKLIASYDEQYATSLKIADAQETVNKALDLGVISGSEATSIMEQYEASLQNLEDPMMKIAQTARDELGDALMSIVDGTASAEDAFKNMARAILKQAFDLLVIKPLMDSLFGSSGIFGGFGSGGSSAAPVTGAGGLYANGGAFNNGNVIPFANGGVVSSPTMFPMAGQQTGVMGEAGPEAIMPLKRGKGGKLGVVAEGGQGDVVINQSFNISANGDDSVKRIIQQEAPKIANYTSQKIMEQRQRGGVMKQTFR